MAKTFFVAAFFNGAVPGDVFEDFGACGCRSSEWGDFAAQPPAALGAASSSTVGNAVKAYDLYQGYNAAQGAGSTYSALNSGAAAADADGIASTYAALMA